MSEFADSKRAALERQGWHCLRCGTNIHDPSCWPGRSGHHRQLRRAADPYQGDSGPHRVKSCIARDIKDYKAMLETLAVKTGDHK